MNAGLTVRGGRSRGRPPSRRRRRGRLATLAYESREVEGKKLFIYLSRNAEFNIDEREIFMNFCVLTTGTSPTQVNATNILESIYFIIEN